MIHDALDSDDVARYIADLERRLADAERRCRIAELDRSDWRKEALEHRTAERQRLLVTILKAPSHVTPCS